MVRPPSSKLGGVGADGVVVLPDGATVIPQSKGACDNETDMGHLMALDDLNNVMKKCALSCLGAEACSASCVVKETGVSEPCAVCFGSSIGCTIKHCALKCMDATSPTCLSCQDEHCTDDFVDCAGLAPPGA